MIKSHFVLKKYTVNRKKEKKRSKILYYPNDNINTTVARTCDV